MWIHQISAFGINWAMVYLKVTRIPMVTWRRVVNWNTIAFTDKEKSILDGLDVLASNRYSLWNNLRKRSCEATKSIQFGSAEKHWFCCSGARIWTDRTAISWVLKSFFGFLGALFYINNRPQVESRRKMRGMVCYCLIFTNLSIIPRDLRKSLGEQVHTHKQNRNEASIQKPGGDDYK